MHNQLRSVSPVTWIADPFSMRHADSVQCMQCGRQLVTTATATTTDILDPSDSNDDDNPRSNNNPGVLTCDCHAAHFCSSSCRDTAWSTHHALLCVGPHAQDHPSYQLKQLSLMYGGAEVYSTIQLACQLVCQGRHSEYLQKAEDHSNESGGDGVTSHGEEKEVCDDEQKSVSDDCMVGPATHELREQTHCLLSRILELNGREYCIGLGEWSTLLVVVSTEKIKVCESSLYSKTCRTLANSDDTTERIEKIGELLSLLENECTEIELMDEPDHYFPPNQWYSLLARKDSRLLPHACIPTHTLCMENGQVTPLQLKSVSSKVSSVTDNPRMSVARIDTELCYEDRAMALVELGHAPCTCLRCNFERRRRDPRSVYVEQQHNNDTDNKNSMYRLLDLAKEQERFDDAMDVISYMIQQEPENVKLQWQRIRIAGWQGEFEQRERLLRQIPPYVIQSCSDMRQALAEIDAYGKDDGSRVPHLADWEAIENLEGDGFVCPNVLDADECKVMLEHTLSFTTENNWSTARHYSVPTTDIPLHQIPAVLTWFNIQLKQRIYPLLRQQFQVQGLLRIFDAFIVQYDASAGQRRLPLHNDNSHISLTIALNPLDEYDGGGTYFLDAQKSFKTEVGGIISFRGELLHAGSAIFAGTRYVIVCFLYDKVGTTCKNEVH